MKNTIKKSDEGKLKEIEDILVKTKGKLTTYFDKNTIDKLFNHKLNSRIMSKIENHFNEKYSGNLEIKDLLINGLKLQKKMNDIKGTNKSFSLKDIFYLKNIFQKQSTDKLLGKLKDSLSKIDIIKKGILPPAPAASFSPPDYSPHNFNKEVPKIGM